jgi:hypothetical protein
MPTHMNTNLFQRNCSINKLAPEINLKQLLAAFLTFF